MKEAGLRRLTKVPTAEKASPQRYMGSERYTGVCKMMTVHRKVDKRPEVNTASRPCRVPLTRSGVKSSAPMAYFPAHFFLTMLRPVGTSSSPPASWLVCFTSAAAISENLSSSEAGSSCRALPSRARSSASTFSSKQVAKQIWGKGRRDSDPGGQRRGRQGPESRDTALRRLPECNKII
jgi:hypothetical protein